MAWRGSLSRSLMYTAKASGLRSSPLSSVPSGFSHSPLSAPRRLTFSNLRILGELGCVQSLMPLHSMESSEDGKQQENPSEWLNLSLGRNQESQSQTRAASVKVYSCNFCRRKFYSSQALGGHQNAHKRERGAARHYMMGLPSMARSLGVQAHSHIQKPGKDGPAAVSIFIEPNTRFGSSLQAQEAADLLWPGSFRFDHEQIEQKSSNSDMLDLNLKL